MIKDSVEEISIQMAGWEFTECIKYRRLEEIFNNFAGDLALVPGSPLKRFKLDISSWYTHSAQAYNFLA